MLRERFSRPLSDAALALSASTDEDRALLAVDLWGSLAHARMLGATGLVPARSARRVEAGLARIARAVDAGRFRLDSALEDVHLNVERALTRAIGDDGARLPTGRSRNDQIAVDLALYLRDRLLDLEAATAEVADALLMAARGPDGGRTVAAWTHLQPAQRVYWAQLLGSHALRFVRDAERFARLRATLTDCPLGSGAIAGSSLPLDRALVARLLGFSRPGPSSIDGVSDRDAGVEALLGIALVALHASALAEELVVGSMPELDRVRLDDAFVTTSSLMPHKRNPDTAELVRASAGPALGRLVAIFTVLKGVPIGYQRDLQVGKPILFDAVRDARTVLAAVAPMVASARFKDGAAFPSQPTASVEIVDALVRAGVPFRRAHARVGRFLARRTERALTDAEVRAAFPELAGFSLPGPAEEPERRTTRGGSARAEVDRLLGEVAARVRAVNRRADRERARLAKLRRALGAPAASAGPGRSVTSRRSPLRPRGPSRRSGRRAP